MNQQVIEIAFLVGTLAIAATVVALMLTWRIR